MRQSAKVKVAIDGDALGDQIAARSAHIGAAMHRLLTSIRDFDIAAGWHVQGALSCAHWLARRVGWDLRTARERVRVACKLAESPLVDGGETALANLMLLCHEGRCRVEADGAHGWNFFDHRNRRIEAQPARTTANSVGAQSGLVTLHHAHAELGN